jgi:hypothetical protein
MNALTETNWAGFRKTKHATNKMNKKVHKTKAVRCQNRSVTKVNTDESLSKHNGTFFYENF